MQPPRTEAKKTVKPGKGRRERKGDFPSATEKEAVEERWGSVARRRRRRSWQGIGCSRELFALG